MQTIGRNGELLRMRQPLFQGGIVSEIAVVLTDQHRNIFLGNEIEGDVLDCNPLQLRIDRDEIERALLVRFDVMQIPIRFCADDEWQIRH